MDEWARPGNVDVFATGESVLLLPAPEDGESIVGTRIRRGAAALRDVHAMPGHRPGVPTTSTSRRSGGGDEIVRPVAIRPTRTCEIVESGRLFVDAIAGFDLIETPTDADDHRHLVWSAELSGPHVRAVPVSLHVLASPSRVVTVLELLPAVRLRRRHRGFVSDGVVVVDLIAARLSRLDREAPRARVPPPTAAD